MSLPYPDNIFDTVINIEVSGHYHGKYDEAFSEIHRVLKPGGKYIFADIFTQDHKDVVTKILSKYFTINTVEDITENVYLSVLHSREWIKNESDSKFRFFVDLYDEIRELYKTRMQTYHIFELIKDKPCH